jgi:hypothetical protein
MKRTIFASFVLAGAIVKAEVSGAPVIDMAIEFGTEDGSAYDEWCYGTPYERLDGFIKSSPIVAWHDEYLRAATTPTSPRR